MKKWSLAFIVMCVLGCLVGCGTKPAEEAEPVANVTIEIPRSMLAEQSDEEVIAHAADEDIDVTITDDETIVYKMSEEKQQELLLSYKTNFEALLQSDMDQGKLMGVVDVSYDENMTEFKLWVNKAVFDAADNQEELGWIYSTGTGCQLFAGIPEESIDVKIIVMDQDSKEEIETYSMRESFFEMKYQANGED